MKKLIERNIIENTKRFWEHAWSNEISEYLQRRDVEVINQHEIKNQITSNKTIIDYTLKFAKIKQ